MEPKEALQVLSEATRKIHADRDSHQLWVDAINVLARTIRPPQEKRPTPDVDPKKDVMDSFKPVSKETEVG